MDALEKAVIAITVVVLGFLVVALGFAVFDGITGYSCGKTSSAMGVEHQYGIIKGCLVNINGTWIPIDNYIVNEEK
jgi:hypothetical protein